VCVLTGVVCVCVPCEVCKCVCDLCKRRESKLPETAPFPNCLKLETIFLTFVKSYGGPTKKKKKKLATL
jgi:hypothetical protein